MGGGGELELTGEVTVSGLAKNRSGISCIPEAWGFSTETVEDGRH